MKKATRQELKSHNTRLLLRTIDAEGEISRAAIARLTKLTRPTVSAIVRELIARGLVVEIGRGPSAGGKRPMLLRIAHEAHHLLCLDLGNREFRGALVNLGGEILERRRLDPAPGGAAALHQLYRLIDELLALAPAPVLGIGIGTPGLVDAGQGLVRQAVNLEWSELPLGSLLEERYGRPVYLANDCQIAALGEHRYGQRENVTNLLLIKVGRGIGSGIIINGQLYFGDGYGAGEIGHMRLGESNELCRCGHYGCLETVASSQALVRHARQLAAADGRSAFSQLAVHTDDITSDTLLQAFQAGDTAVAAMIARAANQLGRAISFMVSSLSINHVVIAGTLARFGQALVGPVQQQVERGTLPAVARATQIRLSSLGDDIVILGAAALVVNQELGIG